MAVVECCLLAAGYRLSEPSHDLLYRRNARQGNDLRLGFPHQGYTPR
jgi:hypothetical protein